MARKKYKSRQKKWVQVRIVFWKNFKKFHIHWSTEYKIKVIKEEIELYIVIKIGGSKDRPREFEASLGHVFITALRQVT